MGSAAGASPSRRDVPDQQRLELTISLVSSSHPAFGELALVVSGEADALSAPGLAHALTLLIRSASLTAVCDVRDVAFVDASGPAVLLGALALARTEGVHLVICGATWKTRRLLAAHQHAAAV